MDTVTLITIRDAVTREHGISLACNAFNQVFADGSIAGVTETGSDVTVAFVDGGPPLGPMPATVDGHGIGWEVMD